MGLTTISLASCGCGGTVRNTGAVTIAAGSIDLSVTILAIIWFFMPLRVSEEDENRGIGC